MRAIDLLWFVLLLAPGEEPGPAGAPRAPNGLAAALPIAGAGRAAFERTAFFGSESDGEATVVVERLGGIAGELSVRVATAGLSASQSLDYAARDVVVVWADGESQPKSVTVPIFDDSDVEPTELVEVLLSSVAVGLGPAILLETGVIAIADDDGPVACSPSAWELCLLGARFRVEVEWRNQRDGQRGIGTAVPFADATGFFWFFDADNIELVTKTLDGRAVTGAFWFFYGALSDVEYWITVTDTEGGSRRLYRNEPGNISGLGDTAAFPDAGGDGPAPPPPAASVTVGVVGCSQTTNAWRGWIDADPGRVWVVASGYGGGDVAEWSRDIPDGGYWERLDANIAANAPATAVWWQICDLAADNGTTEDAEAVLAEIHRRFPGAPVFVSPLADFERPATCLKQDIENSRFLVDHLTSLGLASRGPDLPMVMDSWIQPPEGDGRCHVGNTGRAMFGAALASWAGWGG